VSNDSDMIEKTIVIIFELLMGGIALGIAIALESVAPNFLSRIAIGAGGVAVVLLFGLIVYDVAKK